MRVYNAQTLEKAKNCVSNKRMWRKYYGQSCETDSLLVLNLDDKCL